MALYDSQSISNLRRNSRLSAKTYSLEYLYESRCSISSRAPYNLKLNDRRFIWQRTGNAGHYYYVTAALQ